MATNNSNPVITTAKIKGRIPAIPKDIAPKLTTNPATTFKSTCPATILAKSLTDNVIGLIKNEKNSIRKIRGAISFGTPDGKNICKNPPKPFLTIAKIVMVKKATIARAKVTTK